MYPLPATKLKGPVHIPQLVFCGLLSCTPGVLNQGRIPYQEGILYLQDGNFIFRILFKM